MSRAITPQPHFIQRLYRWSAERFPVANFIVGFIMYGLAVSVLKAQCRLPLSQPLVFHFANGLVVTGEFLLLRVMDEHKDYQTDLINYPERALQRGLISLKHLRIIGAITLLLQLAVSLLIDRGVGLTTAAWALMTVWSLLMLKEFFVPHFLRKRLTLYSTSHMCIMFFTMYWALMLAGKVGYRLTRLEIFMIVNTFICGLSFEVTRKARGREEERVTLDSYSRVLGYGTVSCWMGILLIAIAVTHRFIIAMVQPAPTPWFDDIAMLTLLVLNLVSILKYTRRPTAKTRKMNEGLSGLFSLANYLGIIICGWLAC